MMNSMLSQLEMQVIRRKKDIKEWGKVRTVKKSKIPDYTEEEIKEIEKDFDREEGWKKVGEEFGEDRVVESVLISVSLKKEEKK